MSFVFYDTETTGTHTRFDQILQFAAIQTDWNLNITDRFEVRCRLQPHIIPHPGALCVTGMDIARLTDPSLPSHYAMVCAIRQKLLAWSPATFVGYNSLSFDEHLLRQALYQCLHPPYLTNTHKNCRTDALGIVQATAMIAPDTLVVPRNDKGKAVFKLDQLAPANGFDHSNAHDAMADVEATIHLCRLVQERAPQMWSDAIRFSQKAAVSAFVQEEDAFLLTENFFGVSYQFAVTRIGADLENAGVHYVLDLTADINELRNLDDGALARRLGRSPKVVRRLRANASPMITCLDGMASFKNHSIDELRETALVVREDSELCERLTRVLFSLREDVEESEHVEEQIYAGFFSDADGALMAAFHEADWWERPAIVNAFSDQRLKVLGRRLLYLECPEVLSQLERTAVEAELARRMLGADQLETPWLSLPKALEHTQATLASGNEREQAIAAGLQTYLAERSAFAQRVLGGF